MKNTLIVLMLLSSLMLNAQDRLFTYTYQSNVLSKGQKELEIWTTMENTRENYFRGFKHRLEFEVGLGSKLQTAFYLNYGYSKGINASDSIQTIENKNSFGFSNEWKIKLSDPVANAFGSALYFEYTLGTDEVELEAKVIVDKQVGKTVHALNLVGEYAFINEFEPESDELKIKHEGELYLEVNYGFAYLINKNLSVGLELFNKNKYENDKWKYSLLSAGPALSYNFEGFWVNLSFLPQITNLMTGKQELKNNEKYETRLIFSYVF